VDAKFGRNMGSLFGQQFNRLLRALRVHRGSAHSNAETSCKFESMLSDYADNQLNVKQIQLIESHLAECSSCRVSLASAKLISLALMSKERLEPTSAMSARLKTALAMERAQVQNARRPLTFNGMPRYALAGVAASTLLAVALVFQIHPEVNIRPNSGMSNATTSIATLAPQSIATNDTAKKNSSKSSEVIIKSPVSSRPTPSVTAPVAVISSHTVGTSPALVFSSPISHPVLVESNPSALASLSERSHRDSLPILSAFSTESSSQQTGRPVEPTRLENPTSSKPSTDGNAQDNTNASQDNGTISSVACDNDGSKSQPLGHRLHNISNADYMPSSETDTLKVGQDRTNSGSGTMSIVGAGFRS
jgi:hypothetical protein